MGRPPPPRLPPSPRSSNLLDRRCPSISKMAPCLNGANPVEQPPQGMSTLRRKRTLSSTDDVQRRGFAGLHGFRTIHASASSAPAMRRRVRCDTLPRRFQLLAGAKVTQIASIDLFHRWLGGHVVCERTSDSKGGDAREQFGARSLLRVMHPKSVVTTPSGLHQGDTHQRAATWSAVGDSRPTSITAVCLSVSVMRDFFAVPTASLDHPERFPPSVVTTACALG